MLDHTHTPHTPHTPHTLLLLSVSVMLLWSCSGGSSGTGSTSPPPPAALIIVTTSLPNAQVAHAYSATLSATGGTAPLSWTLSAGALPAGLTLNAASGAISGTPTATVVGTPLTFTVTDSSSTVQTQSISLKLNVDPANITVVPGRAGITSTQTLTLTASTNDNADIAWSVASGGSVSPARSPSGGSVTFTPGAAGVYTLTATSVTNASQTAAVAVGVTDLAGVYTYHNDLARDGANTSEYALTPANVNEATFGKLFSCTVDGAVYAQPLWVANLSVAGSRRNVIFVATQHDSLYAFDADTNTSPCTPLWQVSLIDTAHGAAVPETSVPSGDVPNPLVGQGPGSDISPEVGVTSTPVIDPAGAILYVVSKSVESGSTTIHQRLHAIDLSSGTEKSGSPVTIAATFGSVAYNPGPQNQRAGLALVNGTVYVASSSHDDIPMWYGWIIGYTYNGSAFMQSAALNVAPSSPTGGGGIWMGGGAPSADSSGNLYVITGNGPFDASSATSPNNDYGDSFLQLTPGLGIASWFSPSDEANDYANNVDFGAGGAAIVVNLTSGPLLRHLVVGGGKDGTLYLLNLDGNVHLVGDSKARQFFTIGTEIFATAAFWNDTLYIAPTGSPMLAYAFDPTMQLFLPALAPTPASQSLAHYGKRGSTPAVSASGASSNGILWAIDSTNFCTSPAPACGAAVLHAYSAADLTSELWNSAMVGADTAGYAVKFTVPTVANGKIYIGTRGNNKGGLPQSTSIPGELDVYGLKPN